MKYKSKEIEGYPQYRIFNEGNVVSFKYGYPKELKQHYAKGYKRVFLSKDNKMKAFFAHRLVAQAFIDNPQHKPQINHKDGNKENNRADNLEWVTRKENWKHNKEVLGYSAKGEKNSHFGYRRAKLYPSEELRNKLVALGIPRYKHNLAELGEMLPKWYGSQKYGKVGWWLCKPYGLDPDKHPLMTENRTEANCRAEMLIYLKEKGLL